MRAYRCSSSAGSPFQSGRHAYRLSDRGVDVFPGWPTHAEDRALRHVSDSRVSSGIPALDRMLGDGYWPEPSTLVAGPSGAGKTVMGLSFIFEGAGEVNLGSRETSRRPEQLQRTARGFGWSLDDENVS